MIRKLFLLLLMYSLFLEVYSQEIDTSQIVFRFRSGRDMFFSTWKDNKENIDKVVMMINQQKKTFATDSLKIYVNGYCASVGNTKARLQRAKIMSNRVKGEFIVRNGMKEKHFVTKNSLLPYDKQNPNAVVIAIGKEPSQKAIASSPTMQEKDSVLLGTSTPRKDTVRVFVYVKDTTSQDTVFVYLKDTLKKDTATASTMKQIIKDKNIFSLRTNLLYWAVGMLNIGVEYNPYPEVGILVNGGYAPWASDNWQHNWGGWFVAPELRVYIGKSLRWFAGAQFLAAGYNVKPAQKGYQGTLIAGGITGGYKLSLNKYLDMDFSIGVGYGQLKYDTYQHINTVNSSDALPPNTSSTILPNATTTNQKNFYINKGIVKNSFMPIQAGINLIWKIF